MVGTLELSFQSHPQFVCAIPLVCKKTIRAANNKYFLLAIMDICILEESVDIDQSKLYIVPDKAKF